MKHNRYIPFGYKIVNNENLLNEKEAKAVSEIYNQYINGASLKAIADYLNKTNTVYHETNPVWNKGMVNRILENKKYIGENGYPSIVSECDFKKVKEVVGNRKQFKPTTEFASALKNKLFCSECGNRYHREYRTAKNIVWLCAECNTTFNEITLEATLNQLLYGVKINPETINKQHSKLKEYQPTTDVIKLTNEINRKMEKRESDIAEIKKDILKCASLKYDCCQFDMTPNITETLKAEFLKEDRLSYYYVGIIEKTVASIMISLTGEIQMKFKNGAIITGIIKGKEML